MYESAVPAEGKAHRLVMEGRSKLTATGVTGMVNYDEQGAVMETVKGTLTITGKGIHVDVLSVENGEIHLTGEIQSVSYAENKESGGGFFRRLLR